MSTVEHLRYTRAMVRLATVENFCNILATWLIQKPKAQARCTGLM